MMPVRIAGMGCLSAGGRDRSYFLYNATAAAYVGHAIDPLSGMPVYRVNQFPVNAEIDRFTKRNPVDRSTLLGLYAAAEAVAEAGWDNQKFALLVGCSRGPTDSWERTFREFSEGSGIAPSTSPRTTLGSIASTLAEFFQQTGLSDGVSMTCGSGMHAILHGMALLRSGMAERVLVGGAEAPLTPYTLEQMRVLGIYAGVPTDPRDPACRPLANPSTGMVLGEGAAFLALELSEDSGKPALLGYGLQRESGQGKTGISRSGDALGAAMRMAAAGAGIRPDRVIVHAPGTRRGDRAEVAAVRTVFGPEMTVTSYKSLTGHTLGASGPLAMVGAATLHPGERVLVNATGFGGNAVSLLVG